MTPTIKPPSPEEVGKLVENATLSILRSQDYYPARDPNDPNDIVSQSHQKTAKQFGEAGKKFAEAAQFLQSNAKNLNGKNAKQIYQKFIQLEIDAAKTVNVSLLRENPALLGALLLASPYSLYALQLVNHPEAAETFLAAGLLGPLGIGAQAFLKNGEHLMEMAQKGATSLITAGVGTSPLAPIVKKVVPKAANRVVPWFFDIATKALFGR